ncbi:MULTISPECIES: LysR substrate-binding domain-containing protein [Pseudomonas]|uniref:LysR substrate-binding domain-containing protein n=1 Tax=Pseudomonas TaxID=286 RepID=UPI0004BE4038|nr:MULTISPECIES: LysR substrate-binding domain-containing protein [Pseudomonas]MBJ2349952.1 LysR family transcriptional regulator [Pseudomonas canavaninivorans]MBL3545622.1 LysR family transcriptional regulator [Pseudomonas sp. HB05]
MRRRLPPLNALRTFEAAARLGKMTSAAEELSVTPGAVSRQVRQLELSLGVDLFEGPKNKPQLTTAGKELLPQLTAALDQIEAAVGRVRDTATGTLDVSCFSTFTVKWLIPRLFDFNSTYPDIKIRLSSPVAGADPGRDRYDVMITAEQDVIGEPENTVLLFPERLGIVLSPALAARLQLTDLSSIFSHPLLHTRTRPDAWANWANAVGYRDTPPTGLEYEHYYFTLEAAIAGLGICVAPWHLVADDIRLGRLVAPFGFYPSRYVYLAKRSGQHSKKLELFCAWLAHQAEQDGPPGPA